MKSIVPDLRIAEPCHASWDAMTPASTGRHCASCDKTVIDVTAMTPEAATTYLNLQAPSRLAQGERICVRAHADRHGTLLRPGITRRMLTNGMAMMLAAVSGFSALSDLHGADEDCTPMMGKMAMPVEPIPGPLVEPIKMGEMVIAGIAPVTDANSGITVHVNADANVMFATDATGRERWRRDLTGCGMIERPDRLTLSKQTATVFAGKRQVIVDIHTGDVRDQ